MEWIRKTCRCTGKVRRFSDTLSESDLLRVFYTTNSIKNVLSRERVVEWLSVKM